MSDYKNILVRNLTTKAEVYATPVSMKSCVISFYIANKTTALGYVSVFIRQLGIDYQLSNMLPLSPGSTLQPLDGKKLFLMAGDRIFVESSEEVDIIISYIENI